MNFTFRMVDAGRAARLLAVSCSVAMSLAGCAHDVAGPGEARDLVIVSGDRQEAPYGDSLPQALAVLVRDAAGRAVPGATVHWSADDGGSVSPASSITDPTGHATATWTLGVAMGPQHAHAAVGGTIVASFAATAVAGGDDPRFTPHPLAIETWDGSGQTVHPDIVDMPPTWPGRSRFLVLTPYPGGDARFEDPSLYTGDMPTIWTPPQGVVNPIASITDGAYLSDPDGVAVPELGELWVYYREVGQSNHIYLIRSRDGVHFGAPHLVVDGPNHSVVSPTVVRRGPTDWLMWAVDANAGCAAPTTSVTLRRSANGIDWSEPQTVSLTQPGFFPWHIDVEWIASRNEFWAVYNGKTEGTCATPALFIATSPDGVTWTTYPSPILRRGASPELADIVYRATFSYDPRSDAIDFWYSGARYTGSGYVWSSAYQHRTRRDVFARAARKPIQPLANLRPRAGIPPLLVAP
jgi:hypothetical protein